MELHTDVLVKKEADTFAPNRAHLASLMPYIYGPAAKRRNAQERAIRTFRVLMT